MKYTEFHLWIEEVTDCGGSQGWHCQDLYDRKVQDPSLSPGKREHLAVPEVTQRNLSRTWAHLKQKRNSWRNETLFHVSPPNTEFFLSRLQFLLFVFPFFPSSRQSGERSHRLWLQIPKQFLHHGYPSLAKKRATVLATLHWVQAEPSLDWHPTWQKSSFFTEKHQPRLSLWEWNATNCGASIVWAIQWALHFQSKSKLVKVSAHKLPCRETAAYIKITIILFCHVRSKG